MRLSLGQLPPLGAGRIETPAPTDAGHDGSPADETAAGPAPRRGGRWRALVLEPAAMALVRVATNAYFSRSTVHHRERFPERGPTLVVANHPATWMDVVVLEALLGRPLHFLAQDTLFRPWPRAWLLGWFGSLRVRHGATAHRPDAANRATFALAGAMLARGEVIAVFPEGTSGGDRRLEPLKTGAARIALDHAGASGAPLALVPVGIHYADRTVPRSEVVLDVGPPIDLRPFVASAATNPDHAARALTARIAAALRRRILDAGSPEAGTVVAGVEAALGRSSAPADLRCLRALARRLPALARRDPARFEAIVRASRRVLRVRRALRTPVAFREPGDRAPHGVLDVVGLVPAAIGLATHLAPWAATEWVARHWGADPTRRGFLRIGAGLVWFPLAYAAWAAVLVRALDPVAAAAALVLLPWTGLCAWWTSRDLAVAWHRWRIARLRRGHRALFAKLARASATLLAHGGARPGAS